MAENSPPDTLCLGRVLTQRKMPYYCMHCNTIHRYGSLKYTEHSIFASANVSSDVIEEARRMQAEIEEQLRKHEEEVKKMHKQKIANELEKAKKEEFDEQGFRYFLFEVSSSGFKPAGKPQGYRSKEELIQDNEYELELMDSSRKIFLIIKGKIDEILEGRN